MYQGERFVRVIMYGHKLHRRVLVFLGFLQGVPKHRSFSNESAGSEHLLNQPQLFRLPPATRGVRTTSGHRSPEPKQRRSQMSSSRLWGIILRPQKFHFIAPPQTTRHDPARKKRDFENRVSRGSQCQVRGVEFPSRYAVAAALKARLHCLQIMRRLPREKRAYRRYETAQTKHGIVFGGTKPRANSSSETAQVMRSSSKQGEGVK